MSLIDSKVNLLRQGSSLIAGIMGGANDIEIFPYNLTSWESDSAELELSRNILLILKNESFLDKVCDPAYGSYGIEALTTKISENSYSYFQELEKQGGFFECYKRGRIQEDIQEVHLERNSQMMNGNIYSVGVNIYPEIDDPDFFESYRKMSAFKNESKDQLLPNLRERFSEYFEEMRMNSLVYKKKIGSLPKIPFLINRENKDNKKTLLKRSYLCHLLKLSGMELEDKYEEDAGLFVAFIPYEKNKNIEKCVEKLNLIHAYIVLDSDESDDSFDVFKKNKMTIIRTNFSNTHILNEIQQLLELS